MNRYKNIFTDNVLSEIFHCKPTHTLAEQLANELESELELHSKEKTNGASSVIKGEQK